MTLEALRRDSNALDAAEGDPLRKADIVPVEKRRRIGMQSVKLQEFRGPGLPHDATRRPERFRS